MKKVFFAIMAVLAIACTGCKTDNATVTVTVKDTANNPIKDRAVFYTDKASLIAEAVLPPTPEALIGLDDSSWAYAETNSQGTVTFNVPMTVANLTYYFVVFDLGSNRWVQKEYNLKRGANQDIEFVLNK